MYFHLSTHIHTLMDNSYEVFKKMYRLDNCVDKNVFFLKNIYFLIKSKMAAKMAANNWILDI